MGLHLNSADRTISVLDAFVVRGNGCLVFELWGASLHSLVCVAKEVTPRHTQEVISQGLAALDQLKVQRVVHFDIKPTNILVKVAAADDSSGAPSLIQVKLADFGLSGTTDCIQGARECRFLAVQTWPYRSPEVMLATAALGFPVDMWSMGCVMYFVAAGGLSYFDQEQKITNRQPTEMLKAVVNKRPEGMMSMMGFKVWKDIGGNNYPEDAKNHILPEEIQRTLGKHGCALFDAMLAPSPADRIDPVQAMQHVYFKSNPEEAAAPETPPPGEIPTPIPAEAPEGAIAENYMTLYKDPHGNISFDGERAPWKMLQGNMGADVLSYLQDDDFIKLSPDDLQAKEWHSFEEPIDTQNKKLSCRQLGCKMIISGGFGTPNSTTLHGLNIDHPFPMIRVSGWRDAFLERNVTAFENLGKQVVTSMEAISKSARQANGEQARTTSWRNWLLSGGNVFLTQADGMLLEEDHVDGGAGIVHLGLTLFGHRHLRAWASRKKPSKESRQAGSKPEVPSVVGKYLDLAQEPGTVFLSCSSAFRHQVRHTQSADLIQFGNLPGMSLSIMMRSSLFSHCRARLAGSTPSPQCVFKAIAAVFAEWQSANTLHFPSLDEVKASVAKLTSPSMPTSVKGRKRKLSVTAKLPTKKGHPRNVPRQVKKKARV